MFVISLIFVVVFSTVGGARCVSSQWFCQYRYRFLCLGTTFLYLSQHQLEGQLDADMCCERVGWGQLVMQGGHSDRLSMRMRCSADSALNKQMFGPIELKNMSVRIKKQ